jgi:hypothetical protein
MPLGLNDFLLGGLVPLAASAAVWALWFALRQAGAAWPAGLIAGYAAGTLALETRDSGLAAATSRLVKAHEAHEWTPLIALVAAAPALMAALARRLRAGSSPSPAIPLECLLAAPLCALTPWWLLVGKYRSMQQLAEAGFADDAPTQGQALGILAAAAAALLAGWWLWRRAQGASLPRTRAALAVAAAVGGSMTAALTGSIAYGQAFGVLAAAFCGCAAMSWFFRDASGPEAAAGPAVVLYGSLLMLAASYSEMKIWQAAVLGAAMALSVGALPGIGRRRPVSQGVLRTAILLVPLSLVIWNAASDFVANQRQQEALDAANPYLEYMTK